MPYQNGNNQQNFSVSSSLVSMFDENSNQLRIAGYDSGLQIAIWVPERDQTTGSMRYPKEKRYSCILSQEAAATLDRVVNKEMIDAYTNGRDFKKGVITSRSANNIIDILVNDGNVYVRMHKDLDPNKVPKQTIIFKFQKDAIVSDYNPQTGEFDVEQADVQLAMFCNTISAYNGIAMAAGHGSRVAMNYSIGRMYQYLQAIATKLGATVNGSSYTGNPSVQAGSNYNNQPTYNGGINESNDINALLS